MFLQSIAAIIHVSIVDLRTNLKHQAYRFQECPMRKVIPDFGLILEERMKREKAIDSIMGRVQSSVNVSFQVFVLVRVDEHEAVEVIACEEQSLPCNSLTPACKITNFGF